MVLGHYLAEEYSLGPGSQVDIEENQFRVIGVMSEVGNRQDDRQLYIPVDDLWAITDQYDEYAMIYAKVTEPRVEDIERALERVRGREDFDVLTAESLMETVGDILAVMNAVFMAVASISVLVGSVGIANTMYMAVAERTRDIGIMKAVGASNNDILKVFLLESGFLSLVGGLAGAALGYTLAQGISYLAGTAAGFKGLNPVFTPDLILLTAAMSFVVGILSGLFPARYAAQLEPVDALRHQ
ncbi:FtsX-like permease family protein [Candidatus Woesearchaeota archaeon]|nr:FtsX-like permease family protein [Candidatus Woesearchaeota archaeon]